MLNPLCSPEIKGLSTNAKVQKYEKGKIGLQFFYMWCYMLLFQGWCRLVIVIKFAEVLKVVGPLHELPCGDIVKGRDRNPDEGLETIALLR